MEWDEAVGVQASLTEAGLTWEFTDYARAQHGFTHPTDGADHFHYDAAAQARSWSSMADFLANRFAFNTMTEPMTPDIVTEYVSYIDGGVSLVGYIAYPADTVDPFPEVLHVHQWSGLSDFEKHRAERTAWELGYVGFAVSVYDVNETLKAAASMQGSTVPLLS